MSLAPRSNPPVYASPVPAGSRGRRCILLESVSHCADDSVGTVLREPGERWTGSAAAHDRDEGPKVRRDSAH
jgi:hypothetical protein